MKKYIRMKISKVREVGNEKYSKKADMETGKKELVPVFIFNSGSSIYWNFLLCTYVWNIDGISGIFTK